MNIEVITKEDLKNFKAEMLSEIKLLLKPQAGKQWLRSAEVRKLLNISPATLQNLRINGTLKYTKVGGIVFYQMEDITKVLDGGRS